MAETDKKEKTKPRVLKGTVVADSLDKTVTVLVKRFVRHPKYKKFINKSKKYKVHDESNKFKIGDNVSIVECAPVSKDKKFKIL